LGFGPFDGHTLEIVFWHGIQHLTESGDVAPGFGEVETNVEEG
jgi:hypothetical protein